jgi:hypothetical protein
MHKVPDALIDHVYTVIQELEDHALIRMATYDETFIQCNLCGEVDSHDTDCPLTALYAYTVKHS